MQLMFLCSLLWTLILKFLWIKLVVMSNWESVNVFWLELISLLEKLSYLSPIKISLQKGFMIFKSHKILSARQSPLFTQLRMLLFPNIANVSFIIVLIFEIILWQYIWKSVWTYVQRKSSVLFLRMLWIMPYSSWWYMNCFAFFFFFFWYAIFPIISSEE